MNEIKVCNTISILKNFFMRLLVTAFGARVTLPKNPPLFLLLISKWLGYREPIANLLIS